MTDQLHKQQINDVTTDSKGVIVVTIRGVQTRDSVRTVHTKMLAAIDHQRRHNKKVLVLIDIGTMPKLDRSSEARLARLEAQRLLSDLKVDRCALVGAGKMLNILMYAFRVAHVGTRLKVAPAPKWESWNLSGDDIGYFVATGI